MVVIEKGLQDQVELIEAIPYDNPPQLVGANPLGKVPALLTDDGRAIFDSPIICQFIDSLSPVPRLLPEGAARFDVLTREALCDGILDAALSMVLESRRPAAQRSSDWLDRWSRAINRSLDAVEADIAGYLGDLNLAQVALGAALGYLDLRHPILAWRDGRPQTAAWYDVFSQRASMQATRPDV